MERNPYPLSRKIRHIFGAVFLTGLVVINPVTSLKAATEGKPGRSSSASFSITLTIKPTLRSKVAMVSDEPLDANGSPLATPTDTLSFERPVSLCITGRGLPAFSLAVDDVPGVDVKISASGQTTQISQQTSPVFAVEKNCKNSHRQLIAQPQAGFHSTKQPVTLFIQAE